MTRPTLAVYLGIYVPILILALGILYPLYYFALNSLRRRGSFSVRHGCSRRI